LFQEYRLSSQDKNLVVLGIVPWGVLENRYVLQGDDANGKSSNTLKIKKIYFKH
jgi:hypothetical protein